MIRRPRRGQSIVEAVTAALIIVPVALCLFDLLTIIIANSMNDTACKNATRAAANQPDIYTASSAAQLALTQYQRTNPTWMINNIQLFHMDYNGGTVAATTQVSVRLPVPFPGYSNLIFNAADVEPIVGATPNP